MLEFHIIANEVTVRTHEYDDTDGAYVTIDYTLDQAAERQLYNWLADRQAGRLSQQPLKLDYHIH